VVSLLKAGCINILKQHNVQMETLIVPGAFEIGFAIKDYWENHKHKKNCPHAFIALGCVLKGDTPHFEYVCNAVTDSIVQLNLMLPVPTIFGVLTVNDQIQADERTGGRHGHKGEESAVTALKMIALSQSFKK
jgi:6,7-dimethyl-8-ribityllumazine synthase